MTPAEDTRKRGLGRGLSALFGDEEGADAFSPELDGAQARSAKTVPIEYLRPNPGQPRKRFDEGAIDGLVESIRQQGILQPLLVRAHPDDANAYEIVAGERRWRAAQRAQLHEVPVIVKDLTDTETLEIALIENIHREDLTPLEEAEGYQRLIEEFGHTQDALAKSVGKSRSHVANMLRLSALPDDVRAHVIEGRLSMGHARALLSADDPKKLAEEIIAKGLSVRDTEKAVNSKPKPSSSKKGSAPADGKPAAPRKVDADTKSLENDLEAALGLAVAIEHQGKKGGTVTITYDTLDQLDDVCRRLMGTIL